MKLRRISLSGFKTFARRSDLDLEGGITAVVGPNGSGKSNLVDAIRWALGETNARELRGARMDEVIFSGGQGRAPMGLAEVELTLDNEDGQLAFEDAEVSVGRRVTRGGTSEYRLNGELVRLRDLERVLGATGLTQSGYAVVAQNDIDGIIQATPSQRRVLIEQAAGVRSLRAASDDALQRVVRVENKLLRLDDLLGEAEPRLSELQMEAVVASEQLELRERLQHLRGSLAREEWRAARAQARQARTRLAGALHRAEAVREGEAGITALLAADRERLLAARTAQRATATALESARVDAERVAGERRRWADRQLAGSLQRAQAAHELTIARAELKIVLGDVSKLGENLAGQAALGAELESRLGAARSTQHAAAVSVRQVAASCAELDAELVAAAEALAAADARLRDHSARADLLDEALASLAREADKAREHASALAQAAVAAVAGVERRAAELAAADLDAGRGREQLVEAKEAARVIDVRLADARRNGSRLSAEAAGLRGKVEGALGGRGGVARAVAEGRIDARRLVDSFTALEGGGPAIEAALESHLAAWVVEDLGSALAELGDGGVREEVLAAGLPECPSTGAPQRFRAAMTAIHADASAAGALSHCLRDVWLASDLSGARAAVVAGGRAVLPDGTVVSAAGVRGGGRSGQTIALVAAEREASAAAREQEHRVDELATTARAAASSLAAAEENGERFTAVLNQARASAAEAAAMATSATTMARAEERRSAVLATERTARHAERDGAREARVEASSDRDRTQQRHAAVETAAIAARQIRAVRGGELDEAEGRLRGVEAEVMQLRLHLEDLERRHRSAAEQAEATARRLAVTELRVLESESDILASLAHGRAARDATGRVAAAVGAALDAVAAAATPVAEAEAAVARIEQERSEVAVAVARAADERAAAEADLSTADARVATLADAVRENGEDDGPGPDAQAAERAEREIVRLERRISAMGPVNALAPAQCLALEARVLHLRDSRDDLRNACDDLRALAASLATEIECRFDAVFGAVAVHFERLFGDLFPGGHARLRLEQPVAASVDAGDGGTLDATVIEVEPHPLQLSGVEILAQPAGKRLQPLSLLSGGERALTALAVILALQQVNPSPFYLFDEVDAPLDDSSIGRFTRLLRRLAETQQFLVVTHNHATMAAADTMYGVTIDAEGVSSVLSVRFAGGESRAVVPVSRPSIATAV